MSKRSDSPLSDRFDGSSLDLSEASSVSDMDSDNSRDVNLNSKKFTDNNLFGGEPKYKNNINTNSNKNEEEDLILTSAIENMSVTYNLKSGENEKPENSCETPGSKLESSSELVNTPHSLESRRNSIPQTVSSTPKPESAGSQALCSLFAVSAETSPVTAGTEGQTIIVERTVLNKSVPLSNEEIGKKFQDLSFAFKTDSMTIQKRLQLMKRRRDQAELNIENELEMIKAKLKTLQYLGLNSEYINIKNQLDFVLNATVQLSSSAEGYGYAQHEERLLELVAVMLQHVENVESSRNDPLKTSEKPKLENARSPSSIFLDNARDVDKILRRQSMTLQGDCRRRASIATLPRMGSAIENGNSGKGSQWSTPNRSCGGAAKKLLFSQTSSRANFTSLPVFDDLQETVGIRHRKESRTSEGSMTNIDETPEPSVPPELAKENVESENKTGSDSSLQLKQLFEEVRRSSSSSISAQESITAAYCLRRVLEWNKLLLTSARFRWPENVLQYSPFFITWYIVLVLALVFIGGLFTGINGCHTYSCLKYSALWLAVPAVINFTRRFYRFLLPLFLALVIVMIAFFFWVIKILLPQMSNEGVDSLLRTFGLEIRYPHGPPPI